MIRSGSVGQLRRALDGPLGAALLLAALSFVFLGSFAWPPNGRFLGGDDMVDQWLQIIRLAQTEVLNGRVPGWNPYLAGGLPLLANPQLGLFYPPYWLMWLGSIELAVSWIVALHIFWMAFGTFLLSRRQDLSWLGSFCAALVMGFSGFVVVRASEGHPGFISSVSWLPWMLWAYVRSVSVGTAWSRVWLGLTLAGAALAGNPAGGMLAVFGLGLRVVSDLVTAPPKTERRWLLRPFWIAIPTALGLAAVQLLPSAEYLSLSARSQTSYEFASQYSLPVAHLISLVLPTFFGEPIRLGYWGEFPYMEYMYYPGVVTLTVIALVLRRRHVTPRLLQWVVYGALGLIIALGPSGGLHQLFYEVFPPLRYVRVPARFMVLALLTLAWLAGAAIDAWRTDPEIRISWRPLAAVIGCGGALAAIAYLFFTLQTGDDARAYHIGSALLRATLLAALAGALLASRARGQRWLSGSLIVGLVIADLWGYGGLTLRLTALTPDRAWTLARQTLDLNGIYPERLLPWGLKLEQQNRGQDVALASTSAYDPLMLERSRRFIESVADPRATTFDLLNAQWLLSTEGGAWLSDGDFTQLAAADGFGVYQRPNALPRAWVVPTTQNVNSLDAALDVIHSGQFDARALALAEGAECPPGSGGEAVITSFNPEVVMVSAQGTGLLVLGEAWYPGWTATIDGLPAPVMIANGMLRGVCLTGAPGLRVVQFEFRPTLLVLGSGITAVTIALGAWQAVLSARRQRKRRGSHP